jgi:hypothetical protein
MDSEEKIAERSGKPAERSGKPAERSGKPAERGFLDDGQYHQMVARDVFERVSDLGGLLVVAMVTPVPPANRTHGVERGPKGQAIAAVARKAKDRNAEDENAQRIKDTRLFRQLVATIKEKQPV